MKPIYNSTTGKLCRPRKAKRSIGTMPKHLKQELSSMTDFEKITFQIAASAALINLGIDIISNRG